MSVAEVFLPEKLGRRANLHTQRINTNLNICITSFANKSMEVEG
ncbi:MAG: hypothetical protein ACUZ8N_13520 [Candidatus Scalindua sp.]